MGVVVNRDRARPGWWGFIESATDGGLSDCDCDTVKFNKKTLFCSWRYWIHLTGRDGIDLPEAIAADTDDRISLSTAGKQQNRRFHCSNSYINLCPTPRRTERRRRFRIGSKTSRADLDNHPSPCPFSKKRHPQRCSPVSTESWSPRSRVSPPRRQRTQMGLW